MTKLKLNFKFLLAFEILIGPLFFALSGFNSQLLFSLAFSLVILINYIIYLKSPKQLYFYSLIFLIISNTGVHFAASGKVIKVLNLETINVAIYNFDKFLFHTVLPIFPDGQIALFFEQNAFFSPYGFTGKLLSDLAIIPYISYYFWGYIFVFYLLFKLPKNNKFQTTLTNFLCAWKGAFLITFVCYICFPLLFPAAYSPEIYQKNITGFGLSGFILSTLDNVRSTPEDCFPSGHAAISWIMAIAIYQYNKNSGLFLIFIASWVTFATVYFRYHYVADLIAAIPVVIIALAWGGYFKRKSI